MSWHDPSHTGTGIFVNRENLVFALPLISVCSVYAYFKLVPLNIGLSLIGAGIVLYKVTSSIKTRAVERKEEKIANMDESLLKELAADEMLKEEQQKKSAAKKKVKAEMKARQRIAAQKKKEKFQEDIDDDEDGDMSAFMRNSNRKKKK